jgi:UDP-glucose 4-epimerase
MSRCLVFGGTGFLGRHVVQALRGAGQQVVVSGFGNDAAAADMQLDFRDAAHLAQALEGIETVIHLAWTSVPKSSTDDPVLDVTSNVVGSINLFQACVRSGVHRVVFCSSGGAVYGPASTLPIGETHPVAPQSSYGITKLTVEKYLSMFRLHTGLEYIILRPGNAYGEGQSGFRGQGVIAACLHAALTDTEFVVWGDGSIQRDYVHVGDVAQAFALASAIRAPGEILNIGTGRGRSVDDIIALVGGIVGRRIRVRRDAARAVDVPANVLDSSRAAAVLGWRPVVSLEDGIARQWRALLASNA